MATTLKLDDSNLNLGRVVAVRGSVVDIWFDKNLPSINTLIHTGPDNAIAIEVLSQLDDNRINKLISLISTDKFQQIFITDAREERTKTLLQSVNVDYKLFLVHDNKVVLKE